jgi:hypothetical protein
MYRRRQDKLCGAWYGDVVIAFGVAMVAKVPEGIATDGMTLNLIQGCLYFAPW